MSGHHHNEALPKAALFGAGACVLIAISITGAVSLGILPKPVSMGEKRLAARVAVVAQRDLLFFDQADGSVLIRDITTGSVASTITPGTNSGFIRGVMRGLARERHMSGFGSERPFRLTLWSNQNLSIKDSATGRVIELNGFGDTNRDAFLALLPAPEIAKVAAR